MASWFGDLMKGIAESIVAADSATKASTTPPSTGTTITHASSASTHGSTDAVAASAIRDAAATSRAVASRNSSVLRHSSHDRGAIPTVGGDRSGSGGIRTVAPRDLSEDEVARAVARAQAILALDDSWGSGAAAAAGGAGFGGGAGGRGVARRDEKLVPEHVASALAFEVTPHTDFLERATALRNTAFVQIDAMKLYYINKGKPDIVELIDSLVIPSEPVVRRRTYCLFNIKGFERELLDRNVDLTALSPLRGLNHGVYWISRATLSTEGIVSESELKEFDHAEFIDIDTLVVAYERMGREDLAKMAREFVYGDERYQYEKIYHQFDINTFKQRIQERVSVEVERLRTADMSARDIVDLSQWISHELSSGITIDIDAMDEAENHLFFEYRQQIGTQRLLRHQQLRRVLECADSFEAAGVTALYETIIQHEAVPAKEDLLAVDQIAVLADITAFLEKVRELNLNIHDGVCKSVASKNPLVSIQQTVKTTRDTSIEEKAKIPFGISALQSRLLGAFNAVNSLAEAITEMKIDYERKIETALENGAEEPFRTKGLRFKDILLFEKYLVKKLCEFYADATGIQQRINSQPPGSVVAVIRDGTVLD